MADFAPHEFDANVTAISSNIDRMREDNRRMRALLAQAALFIACQQPNKFREKWLEEVEELTR